MLILIDSQSLTTILSYIILKNEDLTLEEKSDLIKERIEIIKGPYTVRYGATFGGIINLVTKKPNYDDYTCYENLYMINGSGGYGFVLAPYLAKILKENMMSGKKISDRLSPARFFARWAKKL